ncbi:hypothetical protein PIB30_042835, partial [Stylosanthes scabra]|nr:hypothetical protein [Stylosanthes scabra]
MEEKTEGAAAEYESMREGDMAKNLTIRAARPEKAVVRRERGDGEQWNQNEKRRRADKLDSRSGESRRRVDDVTICCGYLTHERRKQHRMSEYLGTRCDRGLQRDAMRWSSWRCGGRRFRKGGAVDGGFGREARRMVGTVKSEDSSEAFD